MTHDEYIESFPKFYGPDKECLARNCKHPVIWGKLVCKIHLSMMHKAKWFDCSRDPDDPLCDTGNRPLFSIINGKDLLAKEGT